MKPTYWLLPDGSLRTRKWPAILGHPRGWVRLLPRGETSAEIEKLGREVRRLTVALAAAQIDRDFAVHGYQYAMADARRDRQRAQEQLAEAQRDLIAAQELATSSLQLLRAQMNEPIALPAPTEQEPTQ